MIKNRNLVVLSEIIALEGFLLLLCGVVLYFSSPLTLGLPVTNDSGIFLYFGRRILAGDLPFRDLWDHKPPLVFYINALGLWIGSGSTRGVWLLEYLALAASGLLGFQLLRKYYRFLPSALAMIGVLGSLVFLLEGGNLTEEFALPFQFGALYLFGISGRANGMGQPRKGVDAWALGIGALLSLAFSLKQTMIGTGVALFLYLGLQMVFGKEKALWRFFLWSALGFSAVQAAWVGYFAAKGALLDYWSVAFVYNFLYSADADATRRLTMLQDLAQFLRSTSGFFTAALLAWLGGAAVFAAGWLRGKRPRTDRPALRFPLAVALIDVPLELALISTSGYNFRHYFMPLLPGFAVLAAWGLDALWTVAQPTLQKRPWRVLVASVGVGVVLALFCWTSVPQFIKLTQQSPDMRLIVTVRYIKDHTQPDETVLLWGTKVNINFLANRTAPTRYAHQKALFRAGYASRTLSDEFLRDLQNHPPALIINTRQNTFPVFSGGPNGPCRPLQQPIPDGMNAVYDYICGHYRLETVLTSEAWEVYRYQK